MIQPLRTDHRIPTMNGPQDKLRAGKVTRSPPLSDLAAPSEHDHILDTRTNRTITIALGKAPEGAVIRLAGLPSLPDIGISGESKPVLRSCRHGTGDLSAR